jgi:hypothetical protein
MKNPAIYKVNDKTLNNGKQTIYSKSITILNTELQEVTLNNIIENAGKAQGYRVYVRDDIISIDTSKPPEGIIRIIGEDVFVETENYNYYLNPKLDFSAFSDTKKIAEIEKSVANSNYVTSTETIPKGEWTVVFAKPNQGKTLTILATIAQQIANGAINGEDVFCFMINGAKPSYPEKLKILKRFDVIVSDEEPLSIMIDLIKNQQAKDKVVIIDMPMRLCDPNKLQNVQLFSKIFEIFCEQGGTVITLAHAEKYVDRDGVPILDGLDLIKDNAHCISYLKRFDDIIKMINIKSRAKVKAEVAFQVGIGWPYPDLFNSLRTLSDKQAAELFNNIKQNQFLVDHEEIIKTIKEAMLCGCNRRTDIAEYIYDEIWVCKRTVYSVLAELEGKLWKMTRGRNNSKVYSII